jgi:RNA polymerase sigma-70 factor (ECF subfamily)
MQDDHLLILQIQNKNESALSKIYDDYSGALYGIILRMCNDEQNAQNLLQDTFLTIWDKADQYDSEKGKFYTWAYRIARNKTLNFLRQTKNLIQIDDLSVDIPEETSSENEESVKLEGFIDTLEEHHRRAIELVYYKGEF